MFDLDFEGKLDLVSNSIRRLMMEAIATPNHKDMIKKSAQVTCMVEGCHAAIIVSMASFAILGKDKKKAELLLEKAVDMFAVRIGTGLDEIRKGGILSPDILEFIPKASKSAEELKKDVDDMVKKYG